MTQCNQTFFGSVDPPLDPPGAALAPLSRGKIAISASIAAKNLKLGTWLICDDPM